MKKPDPSYSRVRRTIRKMDPTLSPNDDAYKVAAILLSGLHVGPNIQEIARFTALPRLFVAKVGRCLRANGIWCGVKIAGSEWFDKETGGCAFWLDVNVGLGYLKRSIA